MEDYDSTVTFTTYNSIQKTAGIMIWNSTIRIIMSKAHQIHNFLDSSLMIPYHGRFI
jgi:uncharacterized membrane protein YqgA involved in biofilm formation